MVRPWRAPFRADPRAAREASGVSSRRLEHDLHRAHRHDRACRRRAPRAPLPCRRSAAALCRPRAPIPLRGSAGRRPTSSSRSVGSPCSRMPSSTIRRASRAAASSAAARAAPSASSTSCRASSRYARACCRPARSASFSRRLSSASRAAWPSSCAARRAPSASRLDLPLLAARACVVPQLALPLLHRREQRVEVPLGVRDPRLGVGQDLARRRRAAARWRGRRSGRALLSGSGRWA